MKELDYILKLRRDIESVNERLDELRAMTQPKGQVISDMPRGGGEQRNTIEDYIVKSEELTAKRDRLEHEIDEKWDDMYLICKAANLTAEQMTLLRYRFYSGNAWKKCLKWMEQEFPHQNWSESKMFRLYSTSLCKINKQKRQNL